MKSRSLGERSFMSYVLFPVSSLQMLDLACLSTCCHMLHCKCPNAVIRSAICYSGTMAKQLCHTVMKF